MKPRLWLLLGLVLACGLILAAASAAHAGTQSPPKSPTNDSAPLVERALLVGQNSASVALAEFESDSWDAQSALVCLSSTTDLCAADHSPISDGTCVPDGAQSLVNQGVRLQI